MRNTETFVFCIFIIETTLILNEQSAISIHQMWSFSGSKAPWLKSKPFFFMERPAIVFVCVILVSHVHDSYRYQFALFSETQTRVKLDHRRDTYIENTGKIVTALRLGQRQGCKKHLNFIPGIVTAFQSGLGQNQFSGFSKGKIIGVGEEQPNNLKRINLFFEC